MAGKTRPVLDGAFLLKPYLEKVCRIDVKARETFEITFDVTIVVIKRFVSKRNNAKALTT